MKKKNHYLFFVSLFYCRLDFMDILLLPVFGFHVNRDRHNILVALLQHLIVRNHSTVTNIIDAILSSDRTSIYHFEFIERFPGDLSLSLNTSIEN